MKDKTVKLCTGQLLNLSDTSHSFAALCNTENFCYDDFMEKFRNKTLGRQFASYKWARNNTLQLLVAAEAGNILSFSPHPGQHTVLYQFQCLVTTSDTYYRRLVDHTDRRFGLIIQESGEVSKKDILPRDLKKYLISDLKRLEILLSTFTDQDYEKHIQSIQSIINHEYLHQGQLVVLFREVQASLPERFAKAFDL